MNWTGGRLHQSKSGRQALTPQQRAYFAKAQTLSKTGNKSRPPPRFTGLEEIGTQDGPPRGTGKDREEQRKLEEFESVAPIVRRLEGMKEKPLKRKRSGNHATEPRMNRCTPQGREDRVNVPKKKTKRTPDATINPQQGFLVDTEKLTIHIGDEQRPIDDIETKRKQLLRRRDWLGTQTAMPVKIKFPSRKDREQIGRRRQLKPQGVKIDAQLLGQANCEPIHRNEPGFLPRRLSRDDISIRVGSQIHKSLPTATVLSSEKAQGDTETPAQRDNRRRLRSLAPPPTAKQQVSDFVPIQYDSGEESSNGYLPAHVRLGAAKDGCIIWSNSDDMLLEEHNLTRESPMLLDSEEANRAVSQPPDEAEIREDSHICYGYRGARRRRGHHTRHDNKPLQIPKRLSRDTHPPSTSPQTLVTDPLDISILKRTPPLAQSENSFEAQSDRFSESLEASTSYNCQPQSIYQHKDPKHNSSQCSVISEPDSGDGKVGTRRLPITFTGSGQSEKRNHRCNTPELPAMNLQAKGSSKEIRNNGDAEDNEDRYPIPTPQTTQLLRKETQQESQRKTQIPLVKNNEDLLETTDSMLNKSQADSCHLSNCVVQFAHPLEASCGPEPEIGDPRAIKESGPTRVEKSICEAQKQVQDHCAKNNNWFNSVFIPELKAYIGSPTPIPRSDRLTPMLSESCSTHQGSSIEVQPSLPKKLEEDMDSTDNLDSSSLNANISQHASHMAEAGSLEPQTDSHSIRATATSSVPSSCSADKETEIGNETMDSQSDGSCSNANTAFATHGSSQPPANSMETMNNCNTEVAVNDTKFIMSKSEIIQAEADIAIANLKALIYRRPALDKTDINVLLQFRNKDPKFRIGKSEVPYKEFQKRLTEPKAMPHRTPFIFTKPARYSGSKDDGAVCETKNVEDDIEDD